MKHRLLLGKKSIRGQTENQTFLYSGLFSFTTPEKNSAEQYAPSIGWTPPEGVGWLLPTSFDVVAHLAHKCEEKGEKLFKLRPKHHSIHHMSSQALKTKLNPRKVMSCFPDETFLGYLKRIAIRCHAAGVLTRTYQRYLMFLGFRWRDGRKSWKDFPGENHRRHWGVPKKNLSFRAAFFANHGANGWTWCIKEILLICIKHMYEVLCFENKCVCFWAWLSRYVMGKGEVY